MSNVWIIRAGVSPGDQEFALKKGCAVIGWGDTGDMSKMNCGEVEAAVRAIREREGRSRSTQYLRQPWHFARTVQNEDWIVLPLNNERGKRSGYAAVGTVSDGYKYAKGQPNGRSHQRPVKWKHSAFPVKAMPLNLRDKIGVRGTVKKIGGDELSRQIARMLQGRNFASDERGRNLKQLIADAFPDHDLEGLVAEIMNAMGYQTEELKKGADGGVDVFAFRYDWLGLEDAVCAQVKNSQGSKGAPDIQHLVGAMSEPIKRVDSKGPFHKGLFVSMSGFAKREVLEKRFPHIRLWDGDDVLHLVGEHYDELDEECIKRLPPKKEFLALEVAGSVQ